MNPASLTLEEAARTLAESLGLKLGGDGHAFAGQYGRKGLYAYSEHHDTYPNTAFFGRGGTNREMLVCHRGTYRPTPNQVLFYFY